MQTSSMRPKRQAPQTWSERAVPWLGGAFGLLFLYHFFTIWMYVVNVPFWDEWAVFDDGALSPDLNLSWIWAQHNEHRMLTNKLTIWALYRLNGWDIGAHQVLNFVLYGGLVWASVALARRVAPRMPLAVSLGFALFLLSPVNHENHYMAFETGFHFVVLFSILAAFWLFQEVPAADIEYSIEHANDEAFAPVRTQSWRALLLGVGFATLAMYSLSNGLIYSAATLLMFMVFKIVRLRALSSAQPAHRKREISQLLVVCVLMMAAAALWFVGWNSTGSVPREAPFSWTFWNWYLNVLSAGFGFESYSALAGVACLVLMVAPLGLPLLRKPLPPGYWAVCAAVLGVLLVLLSITVARASVGMGMSKTPRYVQFVLTFLPVVVAGWWLLLQNASSQKRRLIIGALWVFCFFSLFNDWSYFRYYSDKFLERQSGLECVANYYERGPGQEWKCPSIAPSSVNKQLDTARRLNASFARPENLQDRIVRDTIRNERP